MTTVDCVSCGSPVSVTDEQYNDSWEYAGHEPRIKCDKCEAEFQAMLKKDPEAMRYYLARG